MNHEREERREPRNRRRRFPGILRWPVKIVSAALILALALFFLPHVTRWLGSIWPDPARTQRVSEILRHELKETARLEVLTVDDEGVLTATVEAALIGEVQRVTIEYDYHASIGVDLEKADVQAEGGTITVTLPEMEILSDALTPTKVDRQDFWYPLTEKRRETLLAEERENRAKAALTEARTSETLRQGIQEKLEKLAQSWIGADTWLMKVNIQAAE